MQVSLRRADALSTVLELDKHLAISQADEAAGLIFASHPRKLLNQSFLWQALTALTRLSYMCDFGLERRS